MFSGITGNRRRSQADVPTRPRHTRRRFSRDEDDGEYPEQGTAEDVRGRRVTYYTSTIDGKNKDADKSKKDDCGRDGRHSSRSSFFSSKSAGASSSRTSEAKRHVRKRESYRKSHSTRDTSRRYSHGLDERVYGLAAGSEHTGASDAPRQERSHHRSKRASSAARRNLPIVDEEHDPPEVPEDDVRPEDSVSQVGTDTPAPPHESRTNVDRGNEARPSLCRSKTTTSDADHSRQSNNARPPLSPLPGHKSAPAAPQAVSLVECLTCGSDDVPSDKAVKLSCDHTMCHDCLKRIFELSVKDPAHMPPKCCTDRHISVRHVAGLFDDKFKLVWNRKYDEYNTKDRIYCSTAKCGKWIRPKYIKRDRTGRKYAQCTRCKTKVCTLCSNKVHKSRKCPEDAATRALVEQAKDEGWQRCWSCNAMVERKEGCYHMTCRCLAEFCQLCGKRWKTCNCPLFDEANTRHDGWFDLLQGGDFDMDGGGVFGGLPDMIHHGFGRGWNRHPGPARFNNILPDVEEITEQIVAEINAGRRRRRHREADDAEHARHDGDMGHADWRRRETDATARRQNQEELDAEFARRLQFDDEDEWEDDGPGGRWHDVDHRPPRQFDDLAQDARGRQDARHGAEYLDRRRSARNDRAYAYARQW